MEWIYLLNEWVIESVQFSSIERTDSFSNKASEWVIESFAQPIHSKHGFTQKLNISTVVLFRTISVKAKDNIVYKMHLNHLTSLFIKLLYNINISIIYSRADILEKQLSCETA